MVENVKERLYFKRRYVMYGITTILLFCIPFIKINGNQIFLLSFDRKQLHLLGVAFDMQELYLMPFLLILMFLAIFFMYNTCGTRMVWLGLPTDDFPRIVSRFVRDKNFGLAQKNGESPIRARYELGEQQS